MWTLISFSFLINMHEIFKCTYSLGVHSILGGGGGGAARCLWHQFFLKLICLFIFVLHIDLFSFSYIVQCCILCTSIMFGSICYMHVLIFFCLLIFLEIIILFFSLLFCTLIYFPSFNAYLSNIHFFHSFVIHILLSLYTPLFSLFFPFDEDIFIDLSKGKKFHNCVRFGQQLRLELGTNLWIIARDLGICWYICFVFKLFNHFTLFIFHDFICNYWAKVLCGELLVHSIHASYRSRPSKYAFSTCFDYFVPTWSCLPLLND